jgi:anti-sigma regulatory factor (Ser/Thr protein kinase)
MMGQDEVGLIGAGWSRGGDEFALHPPPTDHGLKETPGPTDGSGLLTCGEGREYFLMVTSETAAAAVPAHRVTFFDDDRDLVAELAGSFDVHLSAGGTAVVIATQTHRHALSVALEGRGVSTRSMERQGRYVAVDAATTLGAILDGGAPAAALFAKTVGGLVERLVASGRPLLAFGEMVGLLWEQGDVGAAIALEDLWNQLASVHTFDLLCAYRRSCLESPSLRAVNDMCAAHDEVAAPRFYGARSDHFISAELSPVFLPVAPAVAAARAFADHAAAALELHSMAADVRIVVSELATNAIRHTASAFQVSVRLLQDVVRVEVHDAGTTYPQLGSARLEDVSGRGLAIVARLARDWGFSHHGDGKMTWAELPLR